MTKAANFTLLVNTSDGFEDCWQPVFHLLTLWRVDTLRSYARPQENAWMFEVFGTRRAHRRRELFLTTNRDLYNPDKTPIIQYTHTGVIKGKWHPAMPELFHAHGIEVDFAKRGFYKRSSWLARKAQLCKLVASNPIVLSNGLRGV